MNRLAVSGGKNISGSAPRRPYRLCEPLVSAFSILGIRRRVPDQNHRDRQPLSTWRYHRYRVADSRG